jgi:antitoxin component of MazEF toxin-antitoxin module
MIAARQKQGRLSKPRPIPEDVRKEIALQIGQRIVWEVDGEKLVGRRVRSVKELAGCLKSGEPLTGPRTSPGAFGEAAVARHGRIARQKP